MFNRNLPKKIYTSKDIEYAGSILERMLHSKKIKYTILDKLFKEVSFKDKQVISLYIDLNSLTSVFYNPIYDEEKTKSEIKVMRDREKMIVSSELLNLVGHYRRYFATRHKMYTNIIFYYSSERDKFALNIYPEYLKDHYAKYIDMNDSNFHINSLLNTQYKLIRLISKYIPHFYFIDTKDINHIIVPYHCIPKSDDNVINIIYTNDKFQSLLSVDREIYWLTMESDKSQLYNRIDINKKILKEDYNFSINLLPYIISIIGSKKRNIEGIRGYAEKKTSKLIEDLIIKGILSDIDYKDPKLFIEDISKSNKFNKDQLDIIERNIKLIKPNLIYNNISELKLLEVLDFIDLYDMESLKSLNNKYYEKHPIILEDILMGEEYIQ